MSFEIVKRGQPMLKATRTFPEDGIRVASHRTGRQGNPLLIFWLGKAVAQRIGLTMRRHSVSILIDQSNATKPRIGILVDDSGDFCAARRYDSFSVHTDSATAARMLKGGYAHDVVPPEMLDFSAGMVVFPLRVMHVNWEALARPAQCVPFNRSEVSKEAVA